MENIEDFRGFEFLYDARVLTEDRWEFPVHRVLLAVRSVYFCNVFCDSPMEQSDFLIPKIQGSTMEIILKYIYTGKVDFTANNITDIMVTSDLLGMEKLLSDSRFFAIRNLTTTNCISLFREGTKNKNLGILKASSRFIEMNFEQIIKDQNSRFQDLAIEYLEQLLCSDSLYVSCERKIWKAIECWISEFPEERKKYLKTLLSYIHFNTAESYLALEVLNHPLVKEDDSHIEFISKQQKVLNHRIPKTIHLITKFYWSDQLLFNGDFELFITYDENIDIWRCVTLKTTFRPNVVLHAFGSLFVFFDTSRSDTIICTFDVISRTWSNLNQLNVRRIDYYAFKLGNHIYVVGGSSNQNRIGHRSIIEIERYNFDTERWEFAVPHNADYNRVAAATIGNKIYIVGLPHYNELLVAYVYDSNTNVWQSINAPNVYGFSFILFAYREQLFIIGDESDRIRRLSSVEVYDACRDSWKDFENLPFSYCNPKTLIIKGVLYVYEDHYPRDFRNPAVFWEETTRTWQAVESSSPFYDLHIYHFCSIEDSEIIKEIREENRDTRWVESPFFAHLNS